MNLLTVHSANLKIQQILIPTMNGRMYDPAIGRVLSPDNFVQDPTNTQCYNRYSYCLNNPLRYSDPSGWFAAAADQYWNMGKEITDFISFSGRRASSFDGAGGGGWGGVGGALPTGIHWMHTTMDDVMGSLYNATPSNGKLYTYSNVNGNWYNTSTTTISVIIEFNNGKQDGYDGGLLASKVPGSYGKPYHVADNTALNRVVVPLSLISTAVSENYHFKLGITDFTQFIPGPIGEFTDGLAIGEMLKSFSNKEYSTTLFQAIEIAGGEYSFYLKTANWMFHTEKMQLGMAGIFWNEYLLYKNSDPERAKMNLHLYQECLDNVKR